MTHGVSEESSGRLVDPKFRAMEEIMTKYGLRSFFVQRDEEGVFEGGQQKVRWYVEWVWKVVRAQWGTERGRYGQPDTRFVRFKRWRGSWSMSLDQCLALSRSERSAPCHNVYCCEGDSPRPSGGADITATISIRPGIKSVHTHSELRRKLQWRMQQQKRKRPHWRYTKVCSRSAQTWSFDLQKSLTNWTCLFTPSLQIGSTSLLR